MNDDTPRVTTDEERDWLLRSRRYGEVCGACRRTLDANETVYWERFVVNIEPTTGGRTSSYRTTLEAPVGRECASPGFLQETAGRRPGRCAECGRGVHYRVARSIRHRVACSWTCRDRAGATERAAKARDAR